MQRPRQPITSENEPLLSLRLRDYSSVGIRRASSFWTRLESVLPIIFVLSGLRPGRFQSTGKLSSDLSSSSSVSTSGPSWCLLNSIISNTVPSGQSVLLQVASSKLGLAAGHAYRHSKTAPRLPACGSKLILQPVDPSDNYPSLRLFRLSPRSALSPPGAVRCARSYRHSPLSPFPSARVLLAGIFQVLRHRFASVSRLSFAFLCGHHRYGGARGDFLRRRGHL